MNNDWQTYRLLGTDPLRRKPLQIVIIFNEMVEHQPRLILLYLRDPCPTSESMKILIQNTRSREGEKRIHWTQLSRITIKQNDSEFAGGRMASRATLGSPGVIYSSMHSYATFTDRASVSKTTSATFWLQNISQNNLFSVPGPSK